jgi:tripeptide aminopeptidase
VSSERLHERFVRLCELPSPTGSERAVTDALAAELAELGIEVGEDGAAVPARAGAGNLVARVAGRDDDWLAFFAHVDTVPHPAPIEVVLADGVYRSRGETILGADDKAAVTVLVELLARHAARPARHGIEVVLTVAEEDGLRGAKALELSELRSEAGFVLDHASPIGELITAAPSYQKLIAEFRGEEAHAGMRPEAGRNAIAAGAGAVAAMQLGRLDDETTANVGLIEGGTAANVVPARCRVEGEARSIDVERAATLAGEMADACAWAASETGCDVEVGIEELFRGYRVPSSSRALTLATAALERCGHEPQRVASGGGSDANALRAAGFDCVLMANGTSANHTPEECVPAKNLDAMLAVCEAIVEEAGTA